MQPDLRRLAKALWAEIQRLGQDNVVELVNNPPILHDAARAGNVELITMLTRANPDLVWHTDSNGYTIFHIAVIHKQECVFSLIHQIGSMKDFIATTQDENGNNILHLAGKLTPLDRRNILPLVGLQMQREIVWFKKVEELAPPSCREMKNNDGLTPREVFSKEHKMLREESETWMRNVADSCLLVSTIMLTVVFAAAFTVPGGYNSETGLPVLMSNNWFICFIVSEVFALFGSIHSILQFWAIMTSSFEEDKFFYALPEILRMGLTGILWSLLGTVTAFFSAYFLVFYVGRARGALPFVLLIYVMLLVSIIMRFFSLWSVVLLQSKLSDVLSAANVIITPALSGTSERLVAQFPLKLLYGLSDANVRSTPAFSGTSERLVAQLPLKLLYVLSGSKRPKYTRLFRQ